MVRGQGIEGPLVPLVHSDMPETGVVKAKRQPTAASE
jgi:hypothetical protein